MRGNINHTESECSMDKLEEMLWSVVWQVYASDTERKVYKTMVRPAVL